MPFPFQKPENTPTRPAVANTGNAAAGNKPATLAGLYTMIEETQGQIAEYLLRREAEKPSGGGEAAAASQIDSRGFSQVLMPVVERLDAIGEMLASGGGGNGGGMSPELGRMIEERFNRLEAYFTGNPPEPQREPATVSPVEYEAPRQPVSHPAQPSNAAWEEAVFGPALANNPALAAHRQSLMQGLQRGDANCRFFAGVLMMFQSAVPEKMVLLMKDLGEAYYRWSPKYNINPDAMEVALQEFAERTCEQAGLANAIELVHPGQRFDSSRHNATSRGVEIVSVLGWVVLRGNGSVYAKATVDVR